MGHGYGLTKCLYCGREDIQYYYGAVTADLYIPEMPQNLCSFCKMPRRKKLITNLAEGMVANKYLTYTFSSKGVYRNLTKSLEFEMGEVRHALQQNNFTVAPNSTDGTIIYESPDGSRVIFKVRGYRRTQEMIIYALPQHPIVKILEHANKVDRKAIKDITPQKPPLPKSQEDFVGEEIVVGDWVAFASMSGADLRIGKITKINEKSVSIMPQGAKKTTPKKLSQVIKIPENRALILTFES